MLNYLLNWRVLIVLVPLLLLSWPAYDYWETLPPGIKKEYVGRQSCIDCHQGENDRWKGSDHDLAMDLATPEFVLGDFDNTQLEHHGIVSKMQQRGEEYFVETEGPNGELAEFKVKYVFGVRPLQQYLTELEDGHVQVLPVTWATEEKRWYYANPDAPFGPDDPLHWTGSAQNWNHMCADCHSTNFHKNYDLQHDAHHYEWSEIDVSCEACHGPGSLHLELANSNSLFWDRHYGYGLPNLKAQSNETQLQTCAPCHSRRRHLTDQFKPGDNYNDHYALTLLEENLYHPDGQILDEVYVYGSFTQSKMYRKNVRCTDCHDPHTARIKFEGNKLCTQCHLPAKYDTSVHHFHPEESKGAQCVECHMPSKKYMVVDPRRDHSLRIPRPDLTVKLGTPNACSNCHTKPEESAQWAADKVVEWYGSKRRDDPHYGEIIAAGRRGLPTAVKDLGDLARSRDVGPIVRATAVSLLATRYPVSDTRKHIERALTHQDDLVRGAALRVFENWEVQSAEDVDAIRELLVPRFRDSCRLVRTEAARVALNLPLQVLPSEDSESFQQALAEYKSSLLLNADQSGTHLSLGVMQSRLGNSQGAINSYRVAIALDPAVAGPRSNLAQMLDEQGRNEEATQLRREELQLLQRDAELLPEAGMLQYRIGLLHYVLGEETEAEMALKKAIALEPEQTDFLMALTLLYEKQKRWSDAIRTANELVDRAPENRMYQQILLNIEQAARQSQ